MLRLLPVLACAIVGFVCSAHAAGSRLPLYEGRDSYAPCAAFGDGVYLVAWQAGRTAHGDLRKGLKFSADLAMCRVDTSGKPLDAKAALVCGAADLQERPRASFGGGVFLVVWQDLRNGKDWDVYAARITPNGKVLDPDGILVSGGPHNQAKPQLAWDGQSFLVVWQDFRNGKLYQIYAARVSADGKVLEPQGIKLAESNVYHCHDPVVASGGSGRSLVLWLGFAPFTGDAFKTPPTQLRFVEQGMPAGATVDVPKQHDGPGDRGEPVWMAASKQAYMAAWKTDAPLGRSNAPNKAHAMLLDEKGEQRATLRLGRQGNDPRLVNADLAWDGTAFAAVWTEYVQVGKDDCPTDAAYAVRVSPEGKILGEIRHLAGVKTAPAASVCVASGGTGVALVAYEQHPASGDIPIQIEIQLLNGK